MWQYTQTELYHFGVKGMKWGQRKKYISRAKAGSNARKAYKTAYSDSLQKNKNGSKSRLSTQNRRAKRTAIRDAKYAYAESKIKDSKYNDKVRNDRYAQKNTPEAKAARKAKIKKAVKIGAAAAGVALAAYGAYNVNTYLNSPSGNLALVKGQSIGTKAVEVSKAMGSKYGANRLNIRKQ